MPRARATPSHATACASSPRCSKSRAESMLATLKREVVRNHVFAARDAARSDVFEYIEASYNRRRAHSLLGYETPTSYEPAWVSETSRIQATASASHLWRMKQANRSLRRAAAG